jgi:molybdopterin converting factor subunit 1
VTVIKVSVLYFAVLREQRGRDQESVEVEPGTTIEALYHRLFPTGPNGRLPVGYAVDQVLVAASHPLQEGAEIAFIPPVGGG